MREMNRMRRLRIALAQINTTVGDFTGNAEKIGRYMSDAAGYGADIVVFPELAVTGYPPEDLLLKPEFVRESMASLNYIAQKTRGSPLLSVSLMFRTTSSTPRLLFMMVRSLTYITKHSCRTTAFSTRTATSRRGHLIRYTRSTAWGRC